MVKLHIVVTIFFVLNFFEYFETKELDLSVAFDPNPISREEFFKFHLFRVHRNRAERNQHSLDMNVTLFTDFTHIPLNLNFYFRRDSAQNFDLYPLLRIENMSVCNVLKTYSKYDFVKLLNSSSNIPLLKNDDDCPTIEVIIICLLILSLSLSLIENK